MDEDNTENQPPRQRDTFFQELTTEELNLSVEKWLLKQIDLKAEEMRKVFDARIDRVRSMADEV